MALLPLQTVNAANVKQQPDPELLKRFEAEQEAARQDRQAAEDKIKEAEAGLRQVEQDREDMQADSNRKLCEMGALPASYCP